jgi:hypothetical protein
MYALTQLQKGLSAAYLKVKSALKTSSQSDTMTQSPVRSMHSTTAAAGRLAILAGVTRSIAASGRAEVSQTRIADLTTRGLQTVMGLTCIKRLFVESVDSCCCPPSGRSKRRSHSISVKAGSCRRSRHACSCRRDCNALPITVYDHRLHAQVNWASQVVVLIL